MIRHRKKQEEISYWLSFSDLMAGLLIIFILVTVVIVLDLNMATDVSKAAEKEFLSLHEEYAVQKEELERVRIDLDNIISINQDIISLLKSKLGGSLEIDEETGAIRLKSSLLFDDGKSDLNPEGEVFIQTYLPGFFEIILSEGIIDQINGIIIYGFTDDVGDYDFNLELSQDRARQVYQFILSDDNFTEFHDDLKAYVVLSGVSQERYLPKLENESIDEWRSRNRRVEIQFELKFRELFEKLKNELASEGL